MIPLKDKFILHYIQENRLCDQCKTKHVSSIQLTYLNDNNPKIHGRFAICDLNSWFYAHAMHMRTCTKLLKEGLNLNFSFPKGPFDFSWGSSICRAWRHSILKIIHRVKSVYKSLVVIHTLGKVWTKILSKILHQCSVSFPMGGANKVYSNLHFFMVSHFYIKMCKKSKMTSNFRSLQVIFGNTGEMV